MSPPLHVRMSWCILVILVRQSEGWLWTQWEEPLSVWIDPDTPEEVFTTQSLGAGGGRYELIMSDEFNDDGREFADGHDPKWTALDRPDTVNDALQYYESSMVTTRNGFLNITTVNEDVTWAGWNDNRNQEEIYTRHYKSGMIQGWNKFCFTGGIIEISVQLPGPGNYPGLWPAAWLMGNLGRATWRQSTEGLWPYSFDHCTPEGERAGVTSWYGSGQRLSKCNPEPGHGLNPHQGRGATELDIFEAMTDQWWGSFSSSLQLAPGLPAELRPIPGNWPAGNQWYKDLHYGDGVELNYHYYGAQGSDALSAIIDTHGGTYYTQQHIYRLEWVPGIVGYIRWYVDGVFKFEVPASSIENQYMGTPPRKIPEEPMYLIFNTAMSNSWSQVCHDGNPARCPQGSQEDCCKYLFPAYYLMDWVRVYQDKGDKDMTVGCSPPKFPTKQYIEDNAHLYAPLPKYVPPPAPRSRHLALPLLEFLFVAAAICCGLFLAMALWPKIRAWWRYNRAKDHSVSYNTFPSTPA